jgi:putative heme degradation protein
MLERKEFPRLVQATREEVEQSVLSPKAVDELREILRKDEDVREFFILLKNRELRQQAIEKLNMHLGHRTLH